MQKPETKKYMGTRKFVSLANSEIPDEVIAPGSIESYLDQVRIWQQEPDSTFQRHPAIGEFFRKSVQMLTYIADAHQVETVREVEDALADGAVQPAMVLQWIAEGLAIFPPTYNSIHQGYPQFREALDKVKSVPYETLHAII